MLFKLWSNIGSVMAYIEKSENIKGNNDKPEEYCSSDSNLSTHFDCRLSSIEKKLVEMPDVWEYIIDLRNFIVKQQKKIRKLRRKLKGRETKETSTQTEINKNTVKTITEEIKEAAENVMQKQGFVYEETSGLYYDYNSGYYYNAEYGLYYDGNTGTYMSYDSETQQYVFHSQVQIKPVERYISSPDESKNQGQSQVISSSTMDSLSQSMNLLQDRKRRRSDSIDNVELEEGECSDESCRISECESENSTDKSEYSKQWPPCIRIVVEETSIPTIKAGSLFVITYEGGTLGREGQHDILLPDINVSKHHLKFTFNMEVGSYFVTDLGSRNGTLLNAKRMASSKRESEPFEIAHGARIQIGTTTLVCHIHAGSQTCGLCEPGLLQYKTVQETPSLKKPNKSAEHKEQLKKLKKKFAINQANDGGLAPGYVDRAQARRDTVGSQNEHEKTQAASLDQSISSENKGFKLLSKMGWSEGQSLGKEGTGMLEPVTLVSNHGTSGIGNKDLLQPSKSYKTDVWTKTKKRYEQLQSHHDINDVNDSVFY